MSENDLICFLHHAFIDYIWEKFREKQRKFDIDPETDYLLIARVETGDESYDLRPFHEPNRIMDCFYWLRNIDGNLNNFTDLYEYKNSPECPECGNSPLLTCNTNIGRCIVNVIHDHEEPTPIIIWVVVVGVLGSFWRSCF